MKAQAPPKSWSKKKKQSRPEGRFGVRNFLKNQLFLFVFMVMHSVFSLYLRIRKAWHTVGYKVASVVFYHHRTPELIERDVKSLNKKPSHVSAVLKMEGESRATELERLVNEAADLAVWSACAGIPMLSIYEKSGTSTVAIARRRLTEVNMKAGILKRYLPQIHQTIIQKFAAYFGPQHPGLSVTAPHAEVVASPSTGTHIGSAPRQLKVLLLSFNDGREAMVDLAKTLAEMSQKAKLTPSDIQIDLIDAELSEGIMPEPELLLLFGPYVELQGYPPWQIRLTEIFCLADNHGVGYQVFIRGLRKYAAAQMRHGK